MKNTRELKKAAADAASAAADNSQAVLADAAARANELLAEAQAKAAPMAKEAKVKSADFASRQLDTWEPQIQDALDKVTPAVEAARDRVSNDLLPKLQAYLHDAAEHPAPEPTKKSKKVAKAPKKKSKVRAFGKFVLITGAIAGAVAAVRHFLTPKDDGWTAHEPSKAYVNNNAATPKPATEPAKPAENPTTSEKSEPAEPAKEDKPADEPKADDAKQSQDDSEATEGYGEGSYVGQNPPEGFTIKGNQRSMKYHLPGSGGYERTIAEVWFSSEEAAEAAGFTKAQR